MTPRKRVLVSGAGGFIGRWSVPALCAAGYEVHAVLGPATPIPPPLRDAVVHRLDLLDAAAVAATMASLEPSHLLHFAWVTAPGVYWESGDNARWLAAGTSLLASFRRHGGVRAVLAGTCAEYDWSQVGVCHEATSPLAAVVDAAAGDVARRSDRAEDIHGASAYVRSKLALAAVLRDLGRSTGLSTAWGRVFFQYGPHEHPDRLVASVITRLLSGQEARCSHGRQIRSFLHAADVGSAFAALLDSTVEGAVNIGSAERISIADLIGRIGTRIGRPELVRLGARPASPREPDLLIPDVGRLQEEVRWRPRFGLDDGLADTIAWWRAELASDRAVRR